MARNRILFLLWLLLWLAAWALGAGNVSGGILLGSLLLALGEVLLARRVLRAAPLRQAGADGADPDGP